MHHKQSFGCWILKIEYWFLATLRLILYEGKSILRTRLSYFRHTNPINALISICKFPICFISGSIISIKFQILELLFNNLKVYLIIKTSLIYTCLAIFKIDPFNGIFFKRRQQRFFSTSDVVNLRHILTNRKPNDNSKNLPTWEIINKQVRHVIFCSLEWSDWRILLI